MIPIDKTAAPSLTMKIRNPSFHPPVMIFLVICALCPAQDKAPEQAAKDCATAWFEALISGDLFGAASRAGVPFSVDRKQVLATYEDVKKMHEKIIGDKGKREVPKYEIAVAKDAPALDASFPEHDVFRISITGTKHRIDIYVSKGASPKVIGFSD